MEVWRCDLEGERKWQTQTDERQRENSTRWGMWTGRPQTTAAGMASLAWKWKMKHKGTMALDRWSRGLRGPGPFHGSHPHAGLRRRVLSPDFKAASAPFCSITAPPRSQGANSVPWKLPDSPHLTTMAQMLWHAGEEGILEIARLFQKFNKPCKKKALSWLFSR